MKRENIFERKAECGIRVVGEVLPSVYSVSLGVWVKAGPVFEREDEHGISHFIEHMVFKGTEKRTAKQLASELDAVGGSINAFTGKENTCFYTRTLAEDMELALDILLDMICSPLLAEKDIENEKSVVCEEIYMSADDPEDVAQEALCSTIYADSPLGQAILGTEESVRSFTREAVTAYMDRRYTPENIVIACAGMFSPDELCRLVDEKYIARKNRQTDFKVAKNIFVKSKQTVLIDKDIEQAHIALAFPSCRLWSERSSALAVTNVAFGNSSSSRLFQHIREEKGLVYSIYSLNSSYSDTGYYTIYAAASEANAEKVLRCIIDELSKLRKNGLTNEEFNQAKEQLRRGYLLGLESVSVHASSLGKEKLFLGRTRDDEELLGNLAKVTLEDVNAVVRDLICNDTALTVVSRTRNEKLRKIIEETDFEF